MPVFDYDSSDNSDDHSMASQTQTPPSEKTIDELSTDGKIKPISVCAQERNGYTQFTMTIPADFADALGITGDDYVLAQLLDDNGGFVVQPPEKAAQNHD
ncbi:AbrB/MazE/SpoVT family DNA-binding domain-containing protein [Natrinema sp. CGMCC1.2065]|uniref:AbrB/MazE/SpoVT family DNA-binding domain-containing protein n=1 Tax=Natrinema sp. CGMCC1.2065 TaxID=3445767 RepID=UPI003F4A18A0